MKVSYYELCNKVVIIKEFSMKVTFNNILIIVNKLIKYIMFILFKETAMTSILTYIILKELFDNHELSKKFIIDRDKLFTNKF